MALLLLFVAGCGGDEGSDPSTPAQQAPSARSGDPDDRGAHDGDAVGSRSKSAGPASAEPGPPASDFTPRSHEDSGGGSEQYIVEGGDNSVQEFGREAGRSEFEAAADALHNFLDARAQGNWAAACRYLAEGATRSLEEMAAQIGDGELRGCAAILRRVTNPTARDDLRREAARADVGSVRVEGDRAFVLYRSTGGAVIAIPLMREGGRWRVGSLTGVPLN